MRNDYYFETAYLSSLKSIDETISIERLQALFKQDFANLEAIDTWYETMCHNLKKELEFLEIEDKYYEKLFEDFTQVSDLKEGLAFDLYHKVQKDYIEIKKKLIRQEKISEDLKNEYLVEEDSYLNSLKKFLYHNMQELAHKGTSLSTIFAWAYCELYRYQMIRKRLKEHVLRGQKNEDT